LTDRDGKGNWKPLLRLAVPIICQNFITYGVTLADNLMVGRLGEASINGLFMAAIVQLVLQMLLAGVDSAMSVLATQYWGRGDTERIKDIVAICLRGTLLLSALAAAATFFLPERIMSLLTSSPEAAREGARYLRLVSVSYLFFGATTLFVSAMRAVEIVRIGLINSIAALVINVSLNAVFIFGRLGFPAMGVAGAALATDISRMAEFSIALWFVVRADRNLRLRLRDLARRNGALLKDLVRIGSPLLAGQVVWAVNKFTMRYIVGHFSPSSSAAVSISENLDGLLWVGTVGLAGAMGVLTGKMVGAGDYAGVRAFARRMQIVFACIGVASFMVVMLAGDLFISLYELTPETVAAAHTFLLVLSFSVLGRAYQAPCLMGLVKAGGDTAFVFKNDTFWVFCWVLPSAFIAWRVFHAPDWVVYALLLSDQVTKCAVAFVKINRFRWMKNLTRAAPGERT
jgi:putative MATE family efflux protein